MATSASSSSSSSTSLLFTTICNSTSTPNTRTPSVVAFPLRPHYRFHNTTATSSFSFRSTHCQSLWKVLASPDVLESAETIEPEAEGLEDSEPSPLPVAADQMAPKQKIRIKLRSYWVPRIEDSCKQILDAARNTNAKTMGPVPLPTKKRIYCVLKSPHVHKDARFHFEIRTHQRMIDILYPTAQTIDSLMQLDLPAGVDVEVKL